MAEMPDERELAAEIAGFRASFNVLQFATSDADGIPDASHAPFVRDDEGRFLILVSGLARHTQNLSQRPRASLLLLDSADGQPNLFALRRLQYQCSAEFLDREKDAEIYAGMIDRFRNTFGKFVDTLNSLGDFRLVRLTPVSGKYVRGFAQTFTLGASDSDAIVHVRV